MAGFDARAFSAADVVQLFGGSVPARYLADYLEVLGASSLVVEQRYVDRHFVDDFSSYYARSFRPPETTCQRVHYFRDLDVDALSAVFDSAYKDEAALRNSEATLGPSYLGFVVRRPLHGAPIGRTVLNTYPVEGRRHYGGARRYGVNLLGLRLSVHGLAYQQQDRGAAVCASTALWSALQKVAPMAGHRTPTPSAITRAARSPFPASEGLDQMQMAAALSELGYVADRLAPLENRALFKANLVACLRSQLPVILLMTRKVQTGAGQVLSGHAVTVTGFSEPDQIVDVPAPQPGIESTPMKSGAVQILYVHDDNLGSHAHYELIDSGNLTEDGHSALVLRRGRPDGAGKPTPWWIPDEWTIFGALVPKPDKLRLSVAKLYHQLIGLRRVVKLIFPTAGLNFAYRFAAAVDYKRTLFALGLDEQMLRTVVETPLPRFIGVISVCIGADLVMDIVLDVSEVERSTKTPSVLAIVAPGVPVRSTAWKVIGDVCKQYGCPYATAPFRLVLV